ncbi:MAG: peptide chain release factor N(5)-glutamine methyltransferase [Parcubacteria group bacterium]
MNIKTALFNATKKLKQKKITSALLDAEVILSFVVKKSREFIFAHPEHELTTKQLKHFKSLIDKRATHCPVAYITNNKEFYRLDFFVDKNVLIPRPETELLTEEIIKTAKQQNSKTIADIGAGSGCIAISITKNIPNVRVIATDISASALKIAKRNAGRHNVLNRIKFYQGDLLKPICNKKIDIIVANLPYLPGKKIRALKHEPQNALYAEKNGLAIYDKLFQQIASLKHLPKFILIEIDPRQTTSMKNVIGKYILKTKINILKDLSGKNRAVKIQLA